MIVFNICFSYINKLNVWNFFLGLRNMLLANNNNIKHRKKGM